MATPRPPWSRRGRPWRAGCARSSGSPARRGRRRDREFPPATAPSSKSRSLATRKPRHRSRPRLRSGQDAAPRRVWRADYSSDRAECRGTVAAVSRQWTQTSGDHVSTRSRILLAAGISGRPWPVWRSPSRPARRLRRTRSRSRASPRRRYGRRHKRRSARNRVVPAADPSPRGNDGRAVGVLRIPSCRI